MISAYTACGHPALGVLIKSFWQTEGTPAYHDECILPKGEVELIFSFGDTMPFYRHGAGSGNTPRCFINGISNTPVNLLLPAYQSFFGVILQPAAVKKFLGVPSGIFLNAITDLELIDFTYSELWQHLAACKNFEERTSAMLQWAMKRHFNLHHQELAISRFLETATDITTVSGLANYFCYSTRQLHRKVNELFGMSSEVLLGYKRYQRALNALHNSNKTLTRVAYDCGYYDQAHFNREFKEYTGVTPGTYQQQKSHLAGHLYGVGY
jgi:AraC-like DNA-binding protein